MFCARVVFFNMDVTQIEKQQVKLHSASVVFILNSVNSVARVEETLI